MDETFTCSHSHGCKNRIWAFFENFASQCWALAMHILWNVCSFFSSPFTANYCNTLRTHTHRERGNHARHSLALLLLSFIRAFVHFAPKSKQRNNEIIPKHGLPAVEFGPFVKRRLGMPILSCVLSLHWRLLKKETRKKAWLIDVNSSPYFPFVIRMLAVLIFQHSMHTVCQNHCTTTATFTKWGHQFGLFHYLWGGGGALLPTNLPYVIRSKHSNGICRASVGRMAIE